MRDKIYLQSRVVTPMTHAQIIAEFKKMDNASNSLVACGLSFNQLMKELNK